MRFAFQVRVKNAAIMEAAEKVGGLPKLAEHLNVSYQQLVAWGNLRVYPAYRNPKSKVDWKSIEKKLFDLTGLLLEEIFPPEIATSEFLAIPKKHVIVREVETLALSAAAHLALPPAQEDQVYTDELRRTLRGVLTTLTPREEKVIRLRFGLGDDGEEHSLEEVTQHFGVTRERIRQIETKALRKLRHPGRIKYVKEWITGMTPKQEAEQREFLRKQKEKQNAKERAEKERLHGQGQHAWLLWHSHPAFTLYKELRPLICEVCAEVGIRFYIKGESFAAFRDQTINDFVKDKQRVKVAE